MPVRRLVLFTKPAVPGRVKTRLVGELSAAEAAQLHRAFVEDVAERLLAAEARGELELLTAWALEDREPLPEGPGRSFRQAGATLGDRLHRGLAAASAGGAPVAALGSDHPTVTIATVADAFARLEAGADVVLGPSADGGYFLIALAPHAVRQELFAGVAWSTGAVLDETLERAASLGLAVELLDEGYDVDDARDLRHLADQLADPEQAALCPRTHALLAAWGRLAGTAAATAEVAR